MRVQFEGATHEFPDDAKPEEISSALGGGKGTPGVHPWVAANDYARDPANRPQMLRDLARPARLAVGMDAPKSFDDAAMLAAVNAPLIFAGGAGAGAVLANAPRAVAAAAPALGRIATSVGLSKVRGEDNLHAALEGVGATGGELAGAFAAKILGGPAKALDAIRTRLGKGEDAAVNLKFLDSLLDWWKNDPNAAAQASRALKIATTEAVKKGENARSLIDLDPTGESSKIFEQQVAGKMPFTRGTVSKVSPEFSQAARAVAGNPALRAGADAALSEDVKPGASMALAAQNFNPLSMAARHLK